jgi:hypothetical protein
MKKQIALSEVHAAIPKHLFKKSTLVASLYVLRTIGLAVAFYFVAVAVDDWARVRRAIHGSDFLPLASQVVMWPTYWFFQGLAFAGFWCLSKRTFHESGASALTPSIQVMKLDMGHFHHTNG